MNIDVNYIETEHEPMDHAVIYPKAEAKHYGMTLEPGKFVLKLEPMGDAHSIPPLDLSKFV